MGCCTMQRPGTLTLDQHFSKRVSFPGQMLCRRFFQDGPKREESRGSVWGALQDPTPVEKVN